MKKFTKLTEEQRKEKMQSIHEDLAIGYAELITSDGWKKYLNTMAKFHKYSANNVLLITHQFPEATYVAAYGKWQALGRQVRKGETGIQILAPIVKKQETGESGVVGFRRAHVFDISQTTGEPLPTPVKLLEGEAPAVLIDALTKYINDLGFSVGQVALATGVNGETRYASSQVVTALGLDPAQQAKTLAHELAHVMLHRGEADRTRAEIEAESVAYVVCNIMGLDTSEYSIGYVATWANNDPDLVKKTAQNVVSTANKIVYALEKILEPVAEPAPLP